MDYNSAVENAAEQIAEIVRGGELKGRRVLVLLPPGNSRLAVAEALCRRLSGVKLFVYKPVDGCEAAGVDAGEVYKHVKGGGAAVVVPKDFAEAKELKSQLKKLNKTLKVVYVFLPALYEEVLKKHKVGIQDWQRADYSFAEEDGVELWPRAKGVHLSLLREGLNVEKVKRLKALWEVPEGLLHKAVGVGRAVLEEGFRAALEALAEWVFAALFGPVGGAAQLLVSTAKRLVYRGGDAVLQHLRVEDAAAQIVKWLLAVRDAGEEYEAPLCEAAARINARCDDLKNVALSAESLKNDIEKEVQKALETLRDKVETIRKRLQIVEKIQQPIYRDSIPDVVVKDGVYMLADGVRLVLEGGFGDFAEKVLKELQSGKPVVLKGPRGAGKTTLALLVAQKWVEEGRPVLRLVNFDDKALSETYKNLDGEFLVLADPSPLEVYRRVATSEGGLPVLETRPLRLNAEVVARLLSNAAEKKVPTLVVLTEEEYEEFAKLRDKPSHVVETIPPFEEKFYRSLIEEYGGEKAKTMPREALDELIRQVMQYKAGTALVAKYVGLAMAKGYDPRKALEEGRGDAKKFLKAILAHFLELSEGDVERRQKLFRIYAAKLRTAFELFGSNLGKWIVGCNVDVSDYIFTPTLVKHIAEYDTLMISKEGANVIARINEDLVEESLRELLSKDAQLSDEQFKEWFAYVVTEYAKSLRENFDEKTRLLTGLALLGHYLVLEGASDNRITQGGVITPGAIWLIHLAARHGAPLADPGEACRRLPEKIERGKYTFWDLAVWTAYAYSALAWDKRPADCMESALYALHWSLLHVGPLAELALETAFTALERVGALEVAPQILWAILNKYGENQSICTKALPLLDKLFEGASGRNMAYLAYLAKAYAEAAYKCDEDSAASRAEELLQRLDGQWRVLAAETYYGLAQWYLAKGRLDEAEERVSTLEKFAKELERAMDSAKKEYFKWLTTGPIEDTKKLVTDSWLNAITLLRGRMGLEKYIRGLLDMPNVEVFKEVAKVSKQLYEKYEIPDEYVNYLVKKSFYGRVLFLLGRGAEALQVFKETWEDVSKENQLFASHLKALADVLLHYVVVLIHEGKVEKAKDLLNTHGYLLAFSLHGRAAIRLWSKALGTDLVKVSPVLSYVLSDNEGDYVVFTSLLRTAQPSAEICAQVCGQGSECRNICETLLKAATENAEAVKKLREEVKKYVEERLRSVGDALRRLGIYDEDFQVIDELSGRELVEIYCPNDTFGHTLLLYTALDQHNLRLARAHALIGALIAPRVFAEVYNVLKDASTVEDARRKPDYKTALTKLLLYHI